jgi:hypothetical protein
MGDPTSGGDRAREVVEALADHEDAIGDLYGAYGTRLTASAGFWQGLSAEEYGHGSLMRDLVGPEHKLERDHELDVFVDAKRFPLSDLRAATNDVRDQIEVVGAGRVSLTEALENALALEQEMVERDAYQVFDSDSANVARVLSHLRVSSERHRDAIRELLMRQAR